MATHDKTNKNPITTIKKAQTKSLEGKATPGYCLGKSANNPSFLMTALVKERLLEGVPGLWRHYQLCDPKPFLTALEKLKASHTKSSKPRAKAKAKAGGSMTKPTKPTAKAQ